MVTAVNRLWNRAAFLRLKLQTSDDCMIPLLAGLQLSDLGLCDPVRRERLKDDDECDVTVTTAMKTTTSQSCIQT